MSIYNVHAGHNFNVPGANGIFSETVEARNVKNVVITKLRALGHTVYDCTDGAATTQSKNLANIVAKCNSHKVDLDISIHFNASNGAGNGVEVFQYSSRTKTAAQNVCNAIAKLGFKNRGVKDGTSLYVLKNTKSSAVLIECCFCDNSKDVQMYNVDTMASAIVEGITGQVSDSVVDQPSQQGDGWVERLNAECAKQGFKGYPTVKKGAKGEITKLIQERLNSVGFSLNVDSNFGDKTFNAVLVFQRNRGLNQDGIVGPKTWEYLISGKKY